MAQNKMNKIIYLAIGISLTIYGFRRLNTQDMQNWKTEAMFGLFGGGALIAAALFGSK
jgi:preprotein translocase subunit SecY